MMLWRSTLKKMVSKTIFNDHITTIIIIIIKVELLLGMD